MNFHKLFVCSGILLMTSVMSVHAQTVIDADTAISDESFKNFYFEGNGGVFDVRGVKLTLTDSVLRNNSVYLEPYSQGGAISVANVSTNRGQLVVDNVYFIGNFAEPDESLAGAVKLSGDADIKNSWFRDNSAGAGGAMYTGTKSSLNILNTNFVNNSANYSGGALGIFKTANITKTIFKNNKILTDADEGGGAIFFGSETNAKLVRNEFISNTSMSNGGAISTRAYDAGNNNGAKLDLIGGVFDSNYSDKNGGAIYSTFYSSEKDSDAVYVNDVIFTSNIANDSGGAIYNVGLADRGGNVSKIKIKDSVFMHNYAIENNGGAIMNGGTGVVSLVGNNVFMGNKAAGKLNDIYSTGTVNISGNLTLDGGIAGTGNVNFDNTASLNAKLQTTTIAGATVVANGAKLNLTVDNGTQNGKYDFVTSGATDKFNIADNTFYNLAMLDSGEIQVSKKSTDSQIDTLQKMGFESNTAKSLAAMSGVVGTGNIVADFLFNTLTTSVQSGLDGDVKGIKKLVDGINPETLPVIQAVTTETQSMIDSLTSERMRVNYYNYGQNNLNVNRGGIWAQGLYNRYKHGDKFNGDSRGGVVGIDGTFNRAFMLGAGYSYGYTSIATKMRNTDIDSHNVFIYGQYKPSRWYANATLNYTMSKYKETSDVIGVAIKSDYNVNGLGANVATGYDFNFGLTPEIGLRYLRINVNEYTNNLGIKNKYDDNNLLSGIAGFRYGFNLKNPRSKFILRPELAAAAKYDMLSNNIMTTVTLPGVSPYSLDVENMSRLGGEFGVGLKFLYQAIELSANYIIDVREHYNSQTGVLKLKCTF